jgi:hypothetical protein
VFGPPWCLASALPTYCSEAERLALLEDEERQAGTLGGVEIDDPTLKAALMRSGVLIRLFLVRNRGERGAISW